MLAFWGLFKISKYVEGKILENIYIFSDNSYNEENGFCIVLLLEIY